MSPRTATTITRLDPRYPLLWRDENTVQFGLEATTSIDVTEPWVEPLLRRLRGGIRLSTFDVVAHGAGAPREAARELLARLKPLLVGEQPAAPPVWVDGVNVADGRAQERMRQALADEGITESGERMPGSVAVVVVEGAAAALQFASYLRDDVPHLPVAFERQAAVVGPLVFPGRTPCLSCRDAHEQQRDPAWPMLHAQLVARPVEITAARIAHAAGLVARVLRTPARSTGVMVRVSPDGRVAWHSVRHHEECPCLEPSSRSRPGSETDSAPLDRHFETMRSRAYARPA
jgi:hypothetical protein